MELASALLLTSADVAPSATSSSPETAPATSCTLSHLPPITLCCMLTSFYPSKVPPHYTLTCLWLDVRQLSILCRKLDSLALTRSGQVVVSSWVKYLARNSLPILGIGSTLHLGNPTSHAPPSDEATKPDPRAISRAISEMDDVETEFQALVLFDERRKRSVLLGGGPHTQHLSG